MAVDEVRPAGAPGWPGSTGRSTASRPSSAAASRKRADIARAGQLDVGISFVVAQQDVEARLPLLDQVVFERQRLLFVVDQDVVDVAASRMQRAGLDVGQLVVGNSCARARAGSSPCRRRSPARRRPCTDTRRARWGGSGFSRGDPSYSGDRISKLVG